MATEDAARAACALLRARGEKITSNAVISITGGSKQTVLKHLETVRREFSAAPPADSGFDALNLAAEPFLKRIWAQSKQQAEIEFKRQIKTLLDLQDGLLEDVRQLRANEKALVERVNAAEQAAKEMVDGSDKLSQLLEMVKDLHLDIGKPQDGEAVNTTEPIGDTNGVVALVRLLLDNEKPMARRDIDAALREQGLDGSKARYNALEYGFIRLVPTEKGLRKLTDADKKSA